MSDVKAALKNANGLIKAEDFAEAVKVLENVKHHDDYMVSSMLGLAYFNLGEYEKSVENYKEAIEIDATKAAAWQGLYKLYSTPPLIVNEFAIKVADKIIEISDSEEKKSDALKLRRNVLFELRRFADLEPFTDDLQLCRRIVTLLMPKSILSTTEKRAMSEAFSIIDKLVEDASFQVKYCLWLEKTGSTSDPYLRSILNSLSITETVPADDCAWIANRLVNFMCEDYFCAGKFDPSHWKMLETLYKFSEPTAIYQLMVLLNNNDVSAALDENDRMESTFRKHPAFPYLQTTLLVADEAWEKLTSLMDGVITKTKCTETRLAAAAMKVRASLEIGWGVITDATDLLQQFPELAKLYPEEAGRVAISLGSEVDFTPCTPLQAARLRVRQCLAEEKVANNSDVALLIGSEEWSDFVLAADARMTAGLDGTSLLVKAAKLNPRSSRTFYLLGETLLEKNLSKARSFLERAVKIRPKCEQYVKLYDEALELSKSPQSERLNLLQRFQENRSSPLWLRKRIVSIYLQEKNIDKAILELQYLARACDGTEREQYAVQLAKCYSIRGHVESATKILQDVLTENPEHSCVVQLIQLLIRLRRNDEAIQMCDECIIRYGESKTTSAVKLLSAMARLHLLDAELGNTRIESLKNVIKILTECLSADCHFMLFYRTWGKTLVEVAQYLEDKIAVFQLPNEWNISNHKDLLRMATTFFATVLDRNRDSVVSWYDVAVTLLMRARLEEEENCASDLADRALVCIRKALALTPPKVMRSSLWCKAAEARRIRRDPQRLQQHCLARALALSKTNAEAWLQLAVLYFTYNRKSRNSKLAHTCFEQAAKWNPQLAPAWCGWAMQAESVGAMYEASDMYRHSLSIKPTMMAVAKYAAFVCSTLQKNRPFDPSAGMIDFHKVLDLAERKKLKPQHEVNMGVLCELFGHYDEAKQRLKNIDGVHYARVLLRTGMQPPDIPPVLVKFFAATLFNTTQLLRELRTHYALYQDTLRSIENKDCKMLDQILESYGRRLSIPLIVSALICTKTELSSEVIRVLHRLQPRHELMDVFPTELPDDIDKGVRYLEDDGEEPFRLRHFVAKPMLEILQELRGRVTKDTNQDTSYSLHLEPSEILKR